MASTGSAAGSTATAYRERSVLGAVRAIEPVVAEDLRCRQAFVEERLRTIVSGADPFLTESATYLIAAGGKRLRPLLTLVGAAYGDPDAPGVVTAAAVVELIHTASLHHDDVMDGASLRVLARGAEPPRSPRRAVYVTGSAHRGGMCPLAPPVLCGQAQVAGDEHALRHGSRLGPDAVELQAATMERLVRGQIRETAGPPPGTDPVAHALGVAADKSASLISMAARLGALVAGAPDAHAEILGRVGERLGVAFQLADDLLDITGDPYAAGKAPGTDLRQGVLTLPVRYALAEPGRDARRLRRLVADGPVTDPARLARALGLLRASPALHRVRAEIADHLAGIHAALRALPDIPAGRVLAGLVDFAADRAY